VTLPCKSDCASASNLRQSFFLQSSHSKGSRMPIPVVVLIVLATCKCEHG
jgi:hypothetical protein